MTINFTHRTLIGEVVETLLKSTEVVKLIGIETPGWTWEVVNHIDGDCFTCKVISPYCPDGEWGEIDFGELSKEVTLLTQ